MCVMKREFVIVMLAYISIVVSLEKLSKSIDGDLHTCDLSKCTGMRVFVPPGNISTKLMSNSVVKPVFIFPSETKMIIMIKSVYRKDCSPSVSVPWVGDPSDRTYQYKVDITTDDMSTYRTGKVCRYPTFCNGANCAGASRNLCDDEIVSQGAPRGFSMVMDCSAHRWAFVRNCIQDMACEVTESSTKVVAAWYNGKAVPCGKKPGTTDIVHLDSDYFETIDKVGYFMEKVAEPKIVFIEFHCYADGIGKVCMQKNGTEYMSPLIFDIEKKQGIVLHNNVAIDFSDEYASNTNPKFKDYDSASINDLKSLFEAFEYAHMQTEKNLINIQAHAYKQGLAIQELMKSTARVDDSLIGRVLGKPSKTISITNSGIFKQCACSALGSWDWDRIKKESSNPCDDANLPFITADGRILKNGKDVREYTEQNKDGACSINKMNVKEISFDFIHSDLDLDHIYIPQFTGSSRDWDGWTKSQGMIRDLESSLDEGKQHEKLVEDWLGKLGLDLGTLSILNFFLSHIGWIALIVAIIALLRT